MALYLLTLDSGPVLVRARNGARAAELMGGCADEAIHRIREDGPEGIMAVEGLPDPAERSQRAPRDITTLADKGARRFRDLDTGREWSEPK